MPLKPEHEIEREYYSVKEIAEYSGYSRVTILKILSLYQIPHRKMGNRNHVVSREYLWKVFEVIRLRNNHYGHKIIPLFLNKTKDERNSITATCTALLGKSRPGNGEKAKELQQMAVSERETEYSAISFTE